MRSMVYYSNNNGKNRRQLGGNTPQVAVADPAPMVQQVAQQNFAMNNQGTSQQQATTGTESNFFTGGNKAMGRFENPYLAKSPSQSTDEQIPAQRTEQNADNTNSESVTEAPIGNMQNPNTGVNSDSNAPYGSLSDALNARTATSSLSEQNKFTAEPEKKDGGFFNWVKGLLPKKRPGMRVGETEDEYDRRRTRNMQMVATLADAIRHMGNIVNTSKGAPLQKFNDTNAMLQEGYEKRKKERATKAALEADAAEKQANRSLKERAAKADEAYKRMVLYMKKYGIDRQAAKDLAAAERQQTQDKQKQDNWERNFEEKQRHNKATETISSSKGKNKGGSGSSGKGGRYWFDDKNGKRHYQSNKTMYEQEFYREYGYYPSDSTTTSTKSYDKNGNEVTVTKTQKASPMTANAAKAQNAAAAKKKAEQKNKKAAPSKQNGNGGKSNQNSKPKSKNGYKHTKALGL